MIRIFLGLLFLILLFTLIAHRKEYISARTRTHLFKLIAAGVGVLMLFEYSASRHEAHNRAVMDAYEQGKTLICDDHEVNSTTYFLETGTLSFQAKERYREIRGLIFPIDSCEIKESESE